MLAVMIDHTTATSDQGDQTSGIIFLQQGTNQEGQETHRPAMDSGANCLSIDLDRLSYFDCWQAVEIWPGGMEEEYSSHATEEGAQTEIDSYPAIGLTWRIRHIKRHSLPLQDVSVDGAVLNHRFNFSGAPGRRTFTRAVTHVQTVNGVVNGVAIIGGKYLLVEYQGGKYGASWRAVKVIDQQEGN